MNHYLITVGLLVMISSGMYRIFHHRMAICGKLTQKGFQTKQSIYNIFTAVEKIFGSDRVNRILDEKV